MAGVVNGKNESKLSENGETKSKTAHKSNKEEKWKTAEEADIQLFFKKTPTNRRQKEEQKESVLLTQICRDIIKKIKTQNDLKLVSKISFFSNILENKREKETELLREDGIKDTR